VRDPLAKLTGLMCGTVISDSYLFISRR